MKSNAAREKARPVLFSLMTEKGGAVDAVHDLHLYAREVNFQRVTSIVHLSSHEVEPGQDDKADPMRQLKIDAYYKMKVGKSAICVPPLEVLAFSCTMNNGLTFNIGLCRYPQFIVQPSTGKSIPVAEKDSWVWQSAVQTFVCEGHDDTNIEPCVESHKALVALLEYAEQLGILSSVDDPTDYYRTRYENGLVRSCREVCGCC